jgi:hypothetical protein
MKSLKLKITRLLIIFSLPFIIGSSNETDSEIRFRLSNYTNFTIDENLAVDLFLEYQAKEMNFRLLKLTDPLKILQEMYSFQNETNGFDIWGKNDTHILKYTKEVKTWKKDFSDIKTRWSSHKIEIGKVDETGIYVVQAIQGDQVAYCPVIVSNSALVYKVSGAEIIAFLTDVKSGEFINGGTVSLLSKKNNLIASQKVEDGIHLIKIDTAKSFSEKLLLIGDTGKEIVFSNPYIFFRDFNIPNTMGYIYTNQPVYRPGQEVHFKGIVRKKDFNNLFPLTNEKLEVVIRSPKNKEGYKTELTSNEFGSVWSSFVLEDEADIGNYSISISNEKGNYYGNFEVEEYKKPEYKVTVTTSKKNFTRKDIVTGEVQSDYYFGSPVSNADVSVKIYKSRFWLPWWYWSEHQWFYKSFAGNVFSRNQQKEFVNQIDGKLDKNGKFNFDYQISEVDEFDFNYTFVAEVTDEARRTISGAQEVMITRGEFSLSAFSSKYFVKKGETLLLNLRAYDFSNNPVQTSFELIINKVDYANNTSFEKTIKTLTGTTDEAGKFSIPFLTEAAGNYRFIFSCEDKQGNKLTATASFYVNDKDFPYSYNYSGGTEINLDKEAYEPGDTLSAVILLPHEVNDLLLTYEIDSKVTFFKKISIKGKVHELKIVLDESLSPSFNISVIYVFEKNVYSQNKMVPVLPVRKILTVDITPSQKIFKPSDEAEYKIRVKDYKGRVVPNSEVSFGVIDESIYAIKNETTQPINNFFFSPRHNYVQTYSTITSNYFSVLSRYASLLDKDYFNKKKSVTEKTTVEGSLKDKSTGNVIKNGVRLLFINQYEVRQIIPDSIGKYSLKNISVADYDIALITERNNFVFIKSVSLKKAKNIIDLLVDIPASDFPIMLEEVASDQILRSSTAENRLAVQTGFAKGAGVEADNFQTPQVRSEFVDAIVWIPNLVTDKNGEASVKFKMPDNLTTWRATVRGITKVNGAGQSINTIISRKNLLVRLETPRFLREGDKHFISTTVHNYLSEKKKVRLSFKSDELKVIGLVGEQKVNSKKDNQFDFFLEANSAQRFDWEVEITKPIGQVELYTEALTNEESDAVKISLPVYPNGIKQITPINLIVDKQTDLEFEFTIPNDVDLRTVSLSFLLQPTIAGTILKSLDDLIQYPYGCVEQTMSRFLPAVIASQTFKELKLPLSSKATNELPKIVDAGLKRLYSFAHGDGGWGWWKNDKSDLFMTTYVLNGLLEAQLSGYKIEQSYIDNSTNFLLDRTKDISSIDKTTYSYVLYVLSKNGKFVKENRDYLISSLNKFSNETLDAYSLSLTGLAYFSLSQIKESEKIMDVLLGKIIETERTAYWKEYSNRFGWQYDEVQTTAYSLKLLIKVNPQSKLIQKIVTKLIEQQRGYSWNSTQQTAKVIFALTDFLKISGELAADYTATVKLNNVKIHSQTFTDKNIFADQNKIVVDNNSTSILTHGKNILLVRKEGTGKIYFSGKNEFYQKEKKNEFAKHFKISKEMFRLLPDASPKGITYKKSEIKKSIKSGEMIFVKLKIDFIDEEDKYIIIEDFLPAGFEVVKDETYYNIQNENEYSEFEGDYRIYGRRPWIWRYADKEIRDEKISFFVTNPEKQMTFTYLLKAQIPGDYSIVPTEVSLMYYPEIMELGRTEKISVSE